MGCLGVEEWRCVLRWPLEELRFVTLRRWLLPCEVLSPSSCQTVGHHGQRGDSGASDKLRTLASPAVLLLAGVSSTDLLGRHAAAPAAAWRL